MLIVQSTRTILPPPFSRSKTEIYGTMTRNVRNKTKQDLNKDDMDDEKIQHPRANQWIKHQFHSREKDVLIYRTLYLV